MTTSRFRKTWKTCIPHEPLVFGQPRSPIEVSCSIGIHFGIDDSVAHLKVGVAVTNLDLQIAVKEPGIIVKFTIGDYTSLMMESKRVRFEKNALPHATALYYVSLRWTKNPEDAKDLLQDTFLRALQNFDDYRDGTNCKAWMFTIMYSIFVNKLRKKQREGPVMSDQEIEQKYYASLGKSAELDPNLNWVASEVGQALNDLPEIFRSPILLVDANGFTYEEAAQILNCPVGTVRSRLFRARKLLYVSLKECAQNLGYLNKKKSES